MRKAFLVLAALLGISTNALATSCGPGPDTPTQIVRESPVVFAGRVASVVAASGQGTWSSITLRIDVTESWKGGVGPSAVLRRAGANSLSAFGLAIGQESIFVAQQNTDGSLGWPLCFGLGVDQIEPVLRTMGGEIAGIRRRINMDTTALGPRMELADALLRWRDLPAARAAYAAVLAADGASIPARIGLGRVLIAEGKRDEALAVARDVHRDHPSDADARLFFGQARLATGDLSALPGLSLRGAELDRLDLSGQDLRRQDLRGAKLTRVRLRNADLRGARIEDSDLSFVDLSGADLREAVITAPASFRVILNGADLRLARITGARIGNDAFGEARNVKMDRAHLDRVAFSGMLSGASMQGLIATQVQFSGAYLATADFTGARLSLVRFGRSQLPNVNFAGARLQGVTFTDSMLNDANFRGAALHEVRFPWTFVGGSDFSGATLSVVDFRDTVLGTADFRGTSLQGANLSGVGLECGTLFPRGFHPGRAGMDLTTAQCGGAPVR